MTNSGDQIIKDNLPPLAQRRIHLSRLFLPLVIITALYLAIASASDLNAILETLIKLPVTLWLWVCFMSMINFSARFLRWQLYLKRLSHHIPVTESALIYISGFALTMSPAKAGETLRSVLLHPYQVTFSHSLACFFCERLQDVLLVGLITLNIITRFPTYQNWAIGVFVLFLLVVILFRSHHFGALINKLPGNRITSSSGLFQSAVRQLFSGPTLGLSIVLGLLAWSAQSYALVLITKALGFEYTPLVLMAIYCLSILAGAASFIPGGLGATEAAMAFLLSNIGMQPLDAIAAALTLRLLTLWLAVGLGSLSLLIYNAMNQTFISK